MKEYHIALPDGTRLSPLPEDQMLARYAQGVYPATTLIWTEGMLQWAPITSIAEPQTAALREFQAAHEAQKRFNNPFVAFWHAITHLTFRGRASRREYWMSTLGFFLISLLLGVIAGLSYVYIFNQNATEKDIDIMSTMVEIVLRLLGAIIFIPLGCRRLHDSGHSGHWLWIALVPIAGSLMLLVLFCTDSERGTNKYGANPKGL